VCPICLATAFVFALVFHPRRARRAGRAGRAVGAGRADGAAWRLNASAPELLGGGERALALPHLVAPPRLPASALEAVDGIGDRAAVAAERRRGEVDRELRERVCNAHGQAFGSS